MSSQLRFSASISILTMALFVLTAMGGGFADGQPASDASMTALSTSLLN